MGRHRHIFLYCIVAVILLSAAPALAQVVHEDPSNLRPSHGGNVTGEMNVIAAYMQSFMNSASLNLKAGDFAGAKADFANYSVSCDAYLNDLWRINVSQLDYDTISVNINATRDELKQLIHDSEQYNRTRSDYNASITGNSTSSIAAVSNNAAKLNASYGSLQDSYNNLKSNVTLLEQTFHKNGIDTSVFDKSLNNLNDYVNGLNQGNGLPGAGNAAGSPTPAANSGPALMENAEAMTPNNTSDTKPTATVSINSLPPVLFKNGRLNVAGKLTAGEAPVNGTTLGIGLSGRQVGTARTDDMGQFSVSYVIDAGDPLGYDQLSIYGIDASGQPAGTIYTGQLLVIPYDVLLVLIAAALLIAVIIELIFISVARRKRKAKAKPLLKPTLDVRKIKESPAAAPPSAANKAENMPGAGSPVPFKTMTPSQPADPKFGPQPKGVEINPRVAIPFDDEIDSINSAIKSGNPKEALTHIYVVSRKISAAYGVDIPDSMTHNEFYASMIGRYPSLSKPLTYIVKAYELVNFANKDLSSSEMTSALNDLNKLYAELKKEEEHR